MLKQIRLTKTPNTCLTPVLYFVEWHSFIDTWTDWLFLCWQWRVLSSIIYRGNFLIREEIRTAFCIIMSANKQGEKWKKQKKGWINLYMVDKKWWWCMKVRLVFIEFLPGNPPQAGQPVCIHVCESSLLLCPCHAGTTICCPSKFCPAQQESSHTHTHSSPCPACGQTARWHHTKWPTVDTHTLRPTVHYGPPTESPSKSFCFFLFLDAHVGLINAQKGCLPVCLSLRLFLSMPFGLFLCLGLRT